MQINNSSRANPISFPFIFGFSVETSNFWFNSKWKMMATNERLNDTLTQGYINTKTTKNSQSIHVSMCVCVCALNEYICVLAYPLDGSTRI